jgi:hypothetical protein
MKGKAYWERRAVILKQIAVLKSELKNTDYKAIKYAEGAMTATEFEPTKTQRALWRAEINELEAELASMDKA